MAILVLAAVLNGICLACPCTQNWTGQSSWTLQPERLQPPWTVVLSKSSKCNSKAKDSPANKRKLINFWKESSVFFS